MNDNQNKRLACVVIAIVVLFGGLLWVCCRNGESEDCTGPIKQVNRIKELNGVTRQKNKLAGEAIDRADDRAERAAELNQRASDGLAEGSKLIKGIRADNSEARRIIDELISGHTPEAETARKD